MDLFDANAFDILSTFPFSRQEIAFDLIFSTRMKTSGIKKVLF